MLNILIPSVPERHKKLATLVAHLIKEGMNPNHILIDDREPEKDGGPTTGEKRNDLLARATKKYIWYVDDDDWVLKGGVKAVLKAIKKGKDVIGIDGYMTTDKKNKVPFEIRLGNSYIEDERKGKKIYLRYPNHITPMRRECVKDLKFPMQSAFEDKAWADKIVKHNRLKTQTIAKGNIYHYRFSTTNKLW